MNAEEVQLKIREMLENTQCEAPKIDKELEGYKDELIKTFKKLCRYAEYEDWIKVDINLRRAAFLNDKAICRELDLKREELRNG